MPSIADVGGIGPERARAIRCRGDGVCTDDREQHREAGLRAHPALSEVLDPDAAADVAHRHDRDDDVVHRPEDGDEFRDEVDRRDDPGQQPDQHQPDVERRAAIADERTKQPQDVRDQAEELTNRDVLGSKDPEDDKERGPQRDQGKDDGGDRREFHDVGRCAAG